MIVALFDGDRPRALALADTIATSGPRPATPATVEGFLDAPGLRVVVECASQAAVRAVAAPAAGKGLDLLTISSGALLSPEVHDALVSAAARTGARVIVPSGAIGGMDAIRAVRDRLDEVTLVSTKRPEAYAGAPGFAPFAGTRIQKPTVIFEGSAGEAVPLFPANVNVAATLSLAGLGPRRTKVKVVADPTSPGNVHEVIARGPFVEMRLRFENQPHPDNPKTSALAVYSAIEALRGYCTTDIRVGT
jgi:aspartate dehydrogenase